jgi:hypothetical protein
MNKKKILKVLADYFAKKGVMMTPAEYKAADDTPMRFMVAKRPFGSWARVLQMVKRNFPVQYGKATNPVAAAPKAAPKVSSTMAAAMSKAKQASKKA